MAERDAETMAAISELLAHGYDDASDDHNWMMAQSIYDLAVDPLRTAIAHHRERVLEGNWGHSQAGENRRLWSVLAASTQERVPDMGATSSKQEADADG